MNASPRAIQLTHPVDAAARMGTIEEMTTMPPDSATGSATDAAGPNGSGLASGWPGAARRARLHFVTGKGGTGKTTVAAALALALARDGNRVLLVEVEERQAISRLFDLPPLPYEERRIALAPGGGEVLALAIDVEAALLEYFAMFYNLGFAARSLKKMGAVEFATTLAPGLRDVLLTGKIKETVGRKRKPPPGARKSGRAPSAERPLYDAVVVDAPPTGRVVTFLGVTGAMADLARYGPIHTQATGVRDLLHSDETLVHLVTLLEDMPTTETLDAIEQLRAAGLPVGSVIVNKATQPYLPADLRARVASGNAETAALRRGLAAVDLTATKENLAGLSEGLRRHVLRVEAEQQCRALLAATELPQLELPLLTDQVDLGELYEVADRFTEQGVRV